MTFDIEQIKIDLVENQYGLQMTVFNDGYPLPGQSIGETKDTITKNFGIVKGKYLQLASDTISPEELNEISLKVVIHYFYLYNSWKSQYEKEKNRDLTFLDKDFDHPNTYDKVIQFFKNKYPREYAAKCAILLGKTADELLKYEGNNNDFYNSFR
jgi:hypothetical protein